MNSNYELHKFQEISKQSPTPHADLQFAFDVGHSSLGWAVLQTHKSGDPEAVDLLGTGAVIFRSDDCLATSRRTYRRQRRHIRATRQRISRVKALLLHLGVLTQPQLDTSGCAWPWLLSARTLQSNANGSPILLSWGELWDVLRWYAHNRGYDGNRNWAAKTDVVPGADEEDDTQKVENAKNLMTEFNTKSMAETVCKVSGLDPMGSKKSCHVEPAKRFKARNAAFPRDIVEKELRAVLEIHQGRLPQLSAEFIKALMSDWKALPFPDLKLPKRYSGGLLFGQLLPRFDNRIIATCPISGKKVPGRHCREFSKFRWAMVLANIKVSPSLNDNYRPLTVEERGVLNSQIKESGGFTAKGLTEAVKKLTGFQRSNIDNMMGIPDAEKALVVDSTQKQLTKGAWGDLFPKLPEKVQRHVRIWLFRGSNVSLQMCVDEAKRLNESTSDFELAVSRHLDKENTRKTKKATAVTRESLLKDEIKVKKESGRAAYGREVMHQVYTDVMAGKPHPMEVEGCLYRDEKILQAQLNRPISDQTNNHLVRHRLLILDRLVEDIVREYAGGDKTRVSQLTIEVTRDLQTMSGMTVKQKAQDMGKRISNHKSVAEKLEKELGISNVTAGLIRKARVAEDLGWICPYTGKEYDIRTLVNRAVDKDHIIPYSIRPSNALDSLVITFSEVNKWKGKRTAMRFITEEAGKPVPGLPNVTLTTLDGFKKIVERLDSFKGHDDDKKRKKKRKALMLLLDYEEKEFTQGDLTKTSQLVRLGGQALKRFFQDQQTPPRVISIPGSVTGAVRTNWNLLGCLAQANPEVLDAERNMKIKTEIRDITHLHHALDACVLGLTAHFIPNTGRVWELLSKRRVSPFEGLELRALKVFGEVREGSFQLQDLSGRLKEQISKRLCEKRVVQHVPARMDGLRAEQNVWRVVGILDGVATLRQTRRDPKTQKPEIKETTENCVKLLGLFPETGSGKLKSLKGALVVGENFGVALDPTPQIITFHKVPTKLREIKEINGGRKPRIIRNGQIIEVKEGRYKGLWKVFSVKNMAGGLGLDLGIPDIVRKEPPYVGIKRDVRVATLLKNGLILPKHTLTGIASCPITSSISTPPNAP